MVNTNAKVDPGLKDETGYNIDLGFRGTFRNWLYVDVSLFYLKYNNRRPEYLQQWWNVINWDEINKRYAASKK